MCKNLGRYKIHNGVFALTILTMYLTDSCYVSAEDVDLRLLRKSMAILTLFVLIVIVAKIEIVRLLINFVQES